jgi:Mrp family chromosome partitioning ATPase/NTP pyrophosphatase (non-canonical NTP hydrolase)
MKQTALGAAWRFRWLVLALAFVGAGLAFFAGSTTSTTRYEATASLIVTDPRASTLFSTDQAARDASLYVEDQIAILRSDSVTRRSAEIIEAKIDRQIDPIAFEETLGIYTSAGNEIIIQYTAEDEIGAVTVVNAVVTAYAEVRGEAAAEDSASALSQLDQSIAAIDGEIESISTSIAQYRNSSAQGELDRQYEAALARLLELQEALLTADATRLATLRQELADVDLQLSRYVQIAAIEASDPELARLIEQQSDAIGRRSTLAERRDQLLVDTELLSGGISLASPAQFAEARSTDIVVITFLGGLLGLLAGSGFAYLLALRRRKFGERAQPGWVLETSMLAEIPVFGDEGIRSELPVIDHPGSASAEAFRFVATALDLSRRSAMTAEEGSPAARIPSTYLVTSSGPLEGKTTLIANLALAAARKGHNVLAIDADFGNQSLTELLLDGAVPSAGITEAVEAGLDLASATHSLDTADHLHLLSRGRRPTNAPDFFSLPSTEAFLRKVGELYDMVLIDGPPLLHIAYASILAQLVDQVVVVTRHGGSVARLEDLAQRLDLVGTPLAGYVYNGAPLRYEMTLTDGSLLDVLGQAPD